MKRAAKIEISVLVIVLVGFLITFFTNQWLAVLVRRQLDSNIATAGDSIRITYGDVQVSAFVGKAKITDVYLESITHSADDSTYAQVSAAVTSLSLDGINYYDWLVRRQVHLKGLTIKHPVVHATFFHDQERDLGQELKDKLEAERLQRLEKVLRVARIFVDDAVIGRISIDDASVEAVAYNDSLYISVPNWNMAIYDLGYNVRDQVPHYNDSVFHFRFQDVQIYIPEADLTMQVEQVRAEPNGVLQVEHVSLLAYLDTLHQESVKAGVRAIRVGGFDVAKFNAIKQMEVKNIHLYEPYAEMAIDESEEQEARQQTTQQELAILNDKLQQTNLEMVTAFITGLDVDTILIHDAALDVHSVATAFQVHADSLSLAVYGAGFSLVDEIPYHYNDSVYQFYLGQAHVVTPDGLVGISTSSIRYDNGGAFFMGPTHIHHLVDKWQLADRLGQVPASWIDMRVNAVHTSSKNILKEVFTLNNGFYLDTLYADIQSMSVFRDNRYRPKQPYRLPQSYLMQLHYPFVVHSVHAKVQDMHVEVALTDRSVGMLDLGPLSARLTNVTATPNSQMSLVAKCKVGYGFAQARFNMSVNKACDWHLHLVGNHLDLHFLDAMLYPIVGMKVGCEVDKLTADYGGDTATASGTFCMEYDNLTLHAFKDSQSPFTIVGDLSGLINSAGKTLLNKRNPMQAGKTPLSYQVKWKNNPWNSPALFYIGPCIDGCISTLLPGLFVHKRVPKNRPTKK